MPIAYNLIAQTLEPVQGVETRGIFQSLGAARMGNCCGGGEEERGEEEALDPVSTSTEYLRGKA